MKKCCRTLIAMIPLAKPLGVFCMNNQNNRKPSLIVSFIIACDNLLFKAGEMLNQTPVVSVKSEPYLKLLDTQETALATLMPNPNHKDLFIKTRYYGEGYEMLLGISIDDLIKRFELHLGSPTKSLGSNFCTNA